jgi:hypothetical protein
MSSMVFRSIGCMGVSIKGVVWVGSRLVHSLVAISSAASELEVVIPVWVLIPGTPGLDLDILDK